MAQAKRLYLEVDMTESQVALLAAIIAGAVSILTLVITLVANRAAEKKAAYRRTFEALLPTLSERIHQTIATSVIIGKTNTEEARKNWREKAKVPKESLKILARQLKYPLWGLSEHLQALTRLPDWADHLAAAGVSFDEFDNSVRKYGSIIDCVIKDAYLKGRPPRQWELRSLVDQKDYIQKCFNKSKPPKDLQIFVVDEFSHLPN